MQNRKNREKKMEQSTVSGPPFGTKDNDDHHVLLLKVPLFYPENFFIFLFVGLHNR